MCNTSTGVNGMWVHLRVLTGGAGHIAQGTWLSTPTAYPTNPFNQWQHWQGAQSTRYVACHFPSPMTDLSDHGSNIPLTHRQVVPMVIDCPIILVRVWWIGQGCWWPKWGITKWGMLTTSRWQQQYHHLFLFCSTWGLEYWFHIMKTVICSMYLLVLLHWYVAQWINWIYTKYLAIGNGK